MRFFVKLNIISILYAFTILVPIELGLNIYRINRLTGWNLSIVNTVIGVTMVIGFLLCTLLIIFLTKEWLEPRRAKFWTMILWIPYFVLFVYMIASLFPVTYEGDVPNPGTGLLAIGALVVFPMYILFINSIAITSDDKTITTA